MADNMSEERTRYDLTSADTKIIGFDFQYFYFINELLKLNDGQAIGFEDKDDVHIDLPSNKTVLIQLKHTIKKNANGIPVNLTEKDDDLWKSLSNWSKVICDTASGRKTISDQIDYVKNTEFILATNKPILKNKFILQANKLRNKKLSFIDFEKYLLDLLNKTKDTDVKQHIQDIININKRVLEAFIKKLKFIDTGDDLINEIKLNIQRKMIADNRVNDVFNDLFSELKQDFFNNAKNGNHQVITFQEWLSKYTCIFEKSRQTTLPIRNFQPVFPYELTEQPFIKELIEIGEVDAGDIAQIAQFSEIMLAIKMNLDNWHTDGEITDIDRCDFHKEAFSTWRIVHKKAHRSTKRNLSLNYDNALNCLDNIREKNLKMLTTEIGVDLSNGEFYYLSNKGNIGWKIEWEANYSNESNIYVSE